MDIFLQLTVKLKHTYLSLLPEQRTSKSSMKSMAGSSLSRAIWRTLAKVDRTLASVSPLNFEKTSAPFSSWHFHPNTLGRARARTDLPVPEGPYSRTPTYDRLWKLASTA